MAGPLFYDRVRETTTTTGTGTYTLAGAVTGFQSFAAVGNSNTCYYAVTDGTDWEVGLGTYTSSGTTLARTSILASTNSNAAVSWSAGTKQIWMDAPAAFLTLTPAPNGGTGQSSFSTGDLLYASSSTALSKLSIGSTDDVLTVAGGVPTWAPPSGGFPSGTKMLFVQTSAPTGWTKQTDQNDKALRIISGTVGTGGSSPFSTVFGKTATDGHTLTTAEMPSHAHNYGARTTGAFAAGDLAIYRSGNPSNVTRAVDTAGGDGSHSHGMDIRVQYVDVIYASKD